MDCKINTNFRDNGMTKEGFHCICLSVILIDSVFLKTKNYNPQGLLEEFKYTVNKKRKTKTWTFFLMIQTKKKILMNDDKEDNAIKPKRK